MKKKLLVLIAVCIVALTAAIFLTACDGNETPYLNGMILERGEEKAETSESLDYGDYTIKSNGPTFNHKAYAMYSDGTKKELSASDLTYQYTFYGDTGMQTPTELPETFDELGSWSIQVKYQDYFVYVSFSIVAQTRSYAIVGDATIRYPMTARALTINDDTATAGHVSFLYIEQDKIANPNAPTEAELEDSHWYDAGSEILPGDYYVYANVSAHGDYAAGRTALKPFRVLKGNLIITGYDRADFSTLEYDFNDGLWDGQPTLSNARFVAEGKDWDGRWVDSGVNIQARIMNYPEATEEADINNPDYGKLSLYFEFQNKDNVLSYNEYGSGKTEKIGLTFSSEYYKQCYDIPSEWREWDATVTVIRGSLTKPVISGAGESDKIRLTTDDSDASLLSIAIAKKKDGVLQEGFTPLDEFNGSWWIYLDNITEAGNFTYVISIQDKDNYTWADGTTDDLELNWEVKLLDLSQLKWSDFQTSGSAMLVDAEGNFLNGVYIQYKYSTQDGAELESHPYEPGNYHAEVVSITVNDAHYFVTGELDADVAAGLDFTIS